LSNREKVLQKLKEKVQSGLTPHETADVMLWHLNGEKGLPAFIQKECQLEQAEKARRQQEANLRREWESLVGRTVEFTHNGFDVSFEVQPPVGVLVYGREPGEFGVKLHPDKPFETSLIKSTPTPDDVFKPDLTLIHPNLIVVDANPLRKMELAINANPGKKLVTETVAEFDSSVYGTIKIVGIAVRR